MYVKKEARPIVSSKSGHVRRAIIIFLIKVWFALQW